MSNLVKLASALPAGDPNGLPAILRELLHDPEEKRLVVAYLDVKEIKTLVDTGDTVPVLRVLRIEAVTPEDARAVRTAMRRAYERRAGQDALPLLGDEVDDPDAQQ